MNIKPNNNRKQTLVSQRPPANKLTGTYDTITLTDNKDLLENTHWHTLSF